MKYFLKKLLGHEIFRSMVSWGTKMFLKNLENPPASPPTYLMFAPLLVFSFQLINPYLYISCFPVINDDLKDSRYVCIRYTCV